MFPRSALPRTFPRCILRYFTLAGIICKGRLGGAEMSRVETQKRGSIPLTTLQAHIDYGFATSFTKYGAIGVRVWLHKGPYGAEIEEGESTRQPRGGRRGRA